MRQNSKTQKVRARIDLIKTSEDKAKWLFQGLKSELRQEVKVPGAQISVPSTVSLGLPETKTTRHLTKKQAREPCHMNGQIVEERGWGEGVKGWRIKWFYRNLFASRSCGYQCGCPRERTTDWQHGQKHGQSHKGRYRSHGASCISPIHFITSRPRKTVRKSPLCTRAPLFFGLSVSHTSPDEMLDLLLLFCRILLIFFFHVQLAHLITIQCSYFFADSCAVYADDIFGS